MKTHMYILIYVIHIHLYVLYICYITYIFVYTHVCVTYMCVYIYIYGSREKNSSLMEAKIFHLYGMDIEKVT